jgi:hypothetical protein
MDQIQTGQVNGPASTSPPPSLFWVVVVIRALIAFAIVSVFRDRGQD